MGQPPNLKEPAERETATGQKYEEEEKKKEGVNGKEAPLVSFTKLILFTLKVKQC